MNSDDTQKAGQSLEAAWFAVARRYAVALGAGAALLSLLRDVPVRIASLRGVLAFFTVSLLAKLGFWLLDLVRQPEAEPSEADAAGAEAPVAVEEAQV